MLRAGGGWRLGLVICGVALAASGGAALAKHGMKFDSDSPGKKSQPKQPHSTDPCASLAQHVNKRIGEIKALKAAIEKEKSTPKTLTGVFDMLSGKPFVDEEKIQKIKVARKEAEDLNALLRAGHCPPVDIEKELAKP